MRFMKSDGTFLPHEIELWDSVGGTAAIWVKMDTVYGNSDSQRLIMLWGNPQAADRSNSAAVFDTANGFAGVWHMAMSATGGVRDATANSNTGTVVGDLSSLDPAETVAGAALRFPGGGSYVDIGNTASVDIAGASPLSISAWVKVDALGARDMVVLGKGNRQFQLAFRGTAATFDFDIYTGTGWNKAVPTKTVEAGAWHHVAGVFYPGEKRSRIFIDGVQVGSASLDNINDTDAPVSLGARRAESGDPGQPLRGALDEVRLERASRSAAWVKLCYENQRLDQVLLTFE